MDNRAGRRRSGARALRRKVRSAVGYKFFRASTPHWWIRQALTPGQIDNTRPRTIRPADSVSEKLSKMRRIHRVQLSHRFGRNPTRLDMARPWASSPRTLEDLITLCLLLRAPLMPTALALAPVSRENASVRATTSATTHPVFRLPYAYGRL